MITKLGTLYAGHVDLEEIGFEGIPVNTRFQTNEHLATVFDKATAIAQLMDRTGFDTLWLAEHHFQREGHECVPNILMLAVYLAQVTERIKIGCAVNVPPAWHPLRLAEDYATADILTGGRVIFGVGRGYHTREVEVFGSPLRDKDANRDFFEEQLEIIFKAFNESSFYHHGKHYDIPPRIPYRGYELHEITLVPRPLHLPVECIQPIVSANERGLNFMINHGIKGLIGGGVAVGGAADKVVHLWRDLQAKHGKEMELGSELIIGFFCHLADTEEKAIDEARKYFEESTKFAAPLGFVRGVTNEQLEALADPKTAPTAGLPTLRAAVEAQQWLCGPPKLIVEKLMKIQERYPGLEEIHLSSCIGTPKSVILEQLEWVGKDVMPAFKS